MPRRAGGANRRRAKLVDGFKSRMEREINAQITATLGDADYEPETFPYEIATKYTPDFRLPNGIYVEVKGWFPAEDRHKLKHFKRCHPEIDLRIVLSRLDAPIRKDSKTTNRMWCERHGIPCAEGKIPDEWFPKRRTKRKRA